MFSTRGVRKSVFIIPIMVNARDSVTKNGSQSGAVLVSKSGFALSDVTLNWTYMGLCQVNFNSLK